jgi:hypothetical protein
MPYLVGVTLFLFSFMVFADTEIQRMQGKFVGGLDIGPAMMEIDRSGIKDNALWAYGALRGGYVLNDKLVLGVEGAGWSDSVTAPTEDVLTLMVTAKMFLSHHSGYSTFIRTGWGYAKHRYWESSEFNNDTSGTGYIVGFGSHMENISLSMIFGSGDLSHDSYKAFAISFVGGL